MSDLERRALVRIHINRQAYESPNPTSGKALYNLASIPSHYELFREVTGEHEDQPVDKHAHDIHLVPDEHFYSEKEFKIIVNAEPKTVTKPTLSFDDLVQLGLGGFPTGQNVQVSIDYGMGPKANPQGSLKPGQMVRIKNKMVFDVTATDRS